MQVNCILEAFGHAKTQRNKNSSRFIKLLTIQYCEKRRTLLRGIIHFCQCISQCELIDSKCQYFSVYHVKVLFFSMFCIKSLHSETHS